ncbi:hypothetical protein K502DRAFT_18066 [Neoconidiobolus thromboides FSU 785]|nr:hypothetical protein K502DRAFT_18066 [Neoconidiobolus thromboides FSU 785]
MEYKLIGKTPYSYHNSQRLTQCIISITTVLTMTPYLKQNSFCIALLAISLTSFLCSSVFLEIETWCKKYRSHLLLVLMIPMVEPLISLFISFMWLLLAVVAPIHANHKLLSLSSQCGLLLLNSCAWSLPVIINLTVIFWPNLSIFCKK